MNKLFLTPIQFRDSRLVSQTPSPRKPVSWVWLLVILLAVSLSFLAPKTFWLQAENKGLEQRAAILQDTVTKTSKERKNLKDAIANYKTENASIQFQLQKIQGRLDSITEEKSYLEEILVNKTKEMDGLKLKHGSPVRATAGAVTSDLAQTLKDKDEEIRKLYEQNKILSQKLDQLYKTTNSKMTEINIAKIALEDTISEARRTIDNNWNTVNLGSIRVNPSDSNAPSQQKSQPPARTTTSKKLGKVLAVNEEHGFVVVDLGKVDGINSDSVLILKRNNEPVATLTVLEVRDVMTACNIKELNAGKTIAVNDQASILK